jgi:hypothetical protein
MGPQRTKGTIERAIVCFRFVAWQSQMLRRASRAVSPAIPHKWWQTELGPIKRIRKRCKEYKHECAEPLQETATMIRREKKIRRPCGPSEDVWIPFDRRVVRAGVRY